MAALHRFQDIEYVNWIKAGQALLCMAEGLCDFCEDEVNKYHKDLLHKFPRVPCSGRCRDEALCKACGKWRGEWKKAIHSQLTTRAILCWDNTDRTKWETDAWEIAKIYMGPGQSAFRAHAADTDVIALLQLVLNCQLFTSCISNTKSFQDVREIRNKMFHSADFKLTNTEMKDHIKAMTTLLEDPTQLKNDVKAQEAVKQLKLIKALDVEIQDHAILESERKLWKQKLEGISQEHSLSQAQVDKVTSFVTEQKDINNSLSKEIAAIKEGMTRFEEQHEQLVERVTRVEERRATSSRERATEELQKLKQQLKDVHKRKIDKYLRNKKDSEHITVKTFSDVCVESLVHNSEPYKRLETRSALNSLQLQKDIDNCRQIKVQELFSPDPGSRKIPLKVLVTGKAGVGKTMLAMCLLSMWLEGQLPSTIEYVFFFSMQELSRVTMCSLANLLFTQQGVVKPSNGTIVEYLHQISENTLVVFEGLQEFGTYSVESKSETYDYNTEVETSKLIGSIICGKTLKLANLLVTSRSGGVIEYKVFDRATEIYGFDESRISEYVCKFCKGNSKLKSHIHDYIRNNINICSLCHMPMFCSFICRIAAMGLEYLPITITQLLTKYVLQFTIEHHPRFKGKELGEDDDAVAHIRDPLLRYSKLAKDGISQQPIKVVFSKAELSQVTTTQEMATQEKATQEKATQEMATQEMTTQCGFLTVSTEKAQNAECKKVTRSSYHFSNLMMQEFLASVALVSNLEETEMLLRQTPNEGQLDMVLAFVSGLVGDPGNKGFLQSLGCQTTVTARDLLRLVVMQEGEQRRRDHKASILLLLTLVYESRQPGLWGEIKDFVLKDSKELNLAHTRISPDEEQALVFVMPKWDDVNILDLSYSNIHRTDLVARLGDLTQLTHLRLQGNHELHGPAVMTALLTSLVKLTRLEELNLGGCGLTDEDITRLSNVLPSTKCLQVLELSNSVTKEECRL